MLDFDSDALAARQGADVDLRERRGRYGRGGEAAEGLFGSGAQFGQNEVGYLRGVRDGVVVVQDLEGRRELLGKEVVQVREVLPDLDVAAPVLPAEVDQDVGGEEVLVVGRVV